MKLFIDGSSSKKLDNSAYCVLIPRQKHQVKKEKKVIKTFNYFMTSGEIEREALERASTLIKDNSIIYTDRKDLEQFIRERRKGFENLADLFAEHNIRVIFIPRRFNLAGIYLSHTLLR